MRDNFDRMSNVIKDDNGVKKHKDRLGHLNHILVRNDDRGLKVLDTIIGKIAHSASCEGRQLSNGIQLHSLHALLNSE